MTKGYLHSIETMGLVDGPGIRFVAFLQGCPCRCLFCHNPDTWPRESSLVMEPEELVRRILKYRHYYTEGGVTFSGGEPLFQSAFLLETLKLCKTVHLHTCLDTSGVGVCPPELLDYVDLVLLDIKATDQESYQKMTGLPMDSFLSFLSLCEKKQKKLWLRYVLIPSLNDRFEQIENFKKFIKPIQGIEKIEILPYHQMGVAKYESLGIPYPLKDIPSMDPNRCLELEAQFKTND